MENIVRRNTIACFISDVILGTYFQLPIWIVYQSQFLTYPQIAFYAGLSLITEVIAQLPTGAFADIFGRKWSLSLGNLFMALPMFLIAFYPSENIMPIYAIMWGMGRAFSMGTSKPILYESLVEHNLESHYPKILSRSVVIFQLSAALSITAGGYLYQITPNLPYIVSGLASLIGVFTAHFFIENRSSDNSAVLLKFFTTTKQGFHEVFKNSVITKLTVLYALTLGIAQSSQQFFSQPFMVELGMNDIERSWVAMIIKISIALLGAKIVSSLRIANHQNFLLIIPLTMTISLIPAGFVTLPLAYIIFFGIAFNSGNSDLFLSPTINKHLQSRVRSTAISLQRMFASSIAAFIQWISVATVVSHGIGTFYSYLGLFSLLIILPLAYSLTKQNKL